MPAFPRAAGAAMAAILALCCAPAVQAQAAPAAAPPPISAFFANTSFGGAKLSPDASHLAARSSAKGQRDFLVVVDLHNNSGKIVASYNDADVGDFEWVNNERLVFNTREKNVGLGDSDKAPGLYAVDRDGGQFVQLAERSGGGMVAGGPKGRRLLPWHTFMLKQAGAQDSDHVYVTSPVIDTKREVRYVDLLRVNTRTGASQATPRPGNAKSWVLDHKGEPRLASGSEKGVTTIWYRDPATSAWRVLSTFDTYKGGKDAFEPLGFGSDGTLYAVAHGGKDTTSVFTVDTATGKLGAEPLVVTPGYDFSGSLVSSGDKLLGIRLRTDAVTTVWLDASMQAVQQKLDAALPGTINLMSFPSGNHSEWALVRSYSDKKPPFYHLYNLRTGKLNLVGEAYPGIDPARMGRQDAVRYKARDGMEIPALLTLPANGAKNAPLVVLVHGGPYVHGNHWGWDPETQFLASRGYAVLEPDYSGSRGYGQAHYRAGWRQWGLAMQDDVADGARWAIAQGYADPQRICIAGGSYGGYAALMGLVKDPDLFKCAVNYLGVTDINLLYDGHWSSKDDLQSDYRIHGMPLLVGDQVKDAAQLKATSPIEQAARITQPVLLAYGGADRRVPIYHGSKFRDAVAAHNKGVEWVEYQEEGHGWTQLATRVDFWGRVEKFLDKHIGSKR